MATRAGKTLFVTAVMAAGVVLWVAERCAVAAGPGEPAVKPLPSLLFSELSGERKRELRRFQELAMRGMNLEGTKRGPHYTEVTREERRNRTTYLTTDPKGKEEFARTCESADRMVGGRGRDLSALEWAYIVTRDRKYLDVWRDEFIAEVNRINDVYPTPLVMAQKIGPGNYFIWGKSSLPGCRLLSARSYDLMCEFLTDEDEARFRWQLKKYCDALRMWKADRTNVAGQGEGGNMAALTLGNTAAIWFAIGYDEVIDWAISHVPMPFGRDPGGMLELIRFARDGGHIWGEALIYQWYVCLGMSSLIRRAARYDGRDVWNMESATGVKPRYLVDGVAAVAFPVERTGVGLGSIRIANFGEEGTSFWQDQWINYGGGGRACWQDILRSVYRASNDKGYGWLASINRGVGEPPGVAPIDPKEVSPPQAPCTIFSTAGIAMLRADESPDYWMGRGLAMQVMGGEPRRSAPGDSFSIRLHGAGRMIFPDWAMTYYEVFQDVGWLRSGIRRNSALIDGRETWRHRTLWRNAFWPEVKYLSLRASRYGHDHSERAFMMTKDYLLDVFDMVVEDERVPEMAYYGDPKPKQYAGWSGAGLWDADKKMPDSHTFDYVLHGIGQQFPSNWWNYSASDEMTNERWPNRWFTNEKRAEMGGGGFYVDWIQRSAGYDHQAGMYKSLGGEWFEDQAGVRMHMLGSPGTVAYTLDAPMGDGGHYTERKVPTPPTNVVNPDEHPEMALKTLIVRRRGKEAQFAALHEPYRDRPVIRGFEYLHKPKADDTHRTVGVKVTGPDYVDRLYLTLGLYGEFKDAAGGVAELKEGKKEVKNLTLDWLFKTDPEQVGDAQRWFNPAYDRGEWRQVDAGVNWQRFEKGYYGTAWYAKTVEPVELPADRKVYLVFEGVDEDCWIYLDGKKIHERLAKTYGDSWNVPILFEVTDTFTSAKPHQLVVKVRKVKHQTGIYLPVRVMVDAPERGPKPDPVVTVTSRKDRNERITFRGQAYVRHSGGRLLARGDIAGFCLRAPGVKTLTLNGGEARMSREGEYVVYGDAAEAADGPGAAVEDASAVKPAPTLKPVEISFPQNFVNIDTAAGGAMVVGLTNRSERTVSGSVTLKPGEGLKADRLERAFQNLPPAHRIDLGFKLTVAGALAGKLARVEATVRTAGAPAHSLSTDVAVGVVVEEVPATYRIPIYDYSGDMPGRPKPRSEWITRVFDYIQVRAPGYTLRIDKYSGGTRWIMDPTGLVRTSLAGYPYGMTRSDNWRYRKGETLAGGWLQEVKYQGVSRDEKGNPTLEFSSLSGNKAWRYVLTPRTAGTASLANIDVPGVARPTGLGFEMPAEAWWREEPISIWPSYPLHPRAQRPPRVQKERENLLAGLKPALQLPDELKATGAVYWDAEDKFDGAPSICFDLDKLVGLAGSPTVYVRWPVRLTRDKRYRLAIRMRYENVSGIKGGEWLYTSNAVKIWTGKELGRACYWPRPVRDWFTPHDVVSAARSSEPMSLRISKVPNLPGQGGKVWLGGFVVEEAD